MLNSKLQYMLENDADKTISLKSSDVRKKIRPMFFNVLKLGNKLDLIIEKREFVKTDRPVIYVASHGFKDDVLNTVLTLKDNAYVVFGNIDLFFNTMDGFFLWIYGAQLVNRYDKVSKCSMKDKMRKIIDYGNNIIIFSEATWNLSDNKLMYPLHGGFYDIAKEKDALVVPVVTYKVGKKCYSSVLSPIDVKKYDDIDIDYMIKRVNDLLNKSYDLITINTKSLVRVRGYLDTLKLIINEMNVNKSDFNSIMELLKCKINYIISKLNLESDLNDIESLIINSIKLHLNRVGNIEKEMITTKVRDVMASEKFSLYSKYPDNSYKKKSKDKYEEWDRYLIDTINGTPYFYLDEEETTIYKDKLVNSLDEVMPWLSNEKVLKRHK